MSVLCYHAVDPGWSSPLAVTPEDFEVQLAWLAPHPARRTARRWRWTTSTGADGCHAGWWR